MTLDPHRMSHPMALTLWQPWASAIIYGPKRIENRPWAPSALQRGRARLLAIHAAVRKPRKIELAEVMEVWGREALRWSAHLYRPDAETTKFRDILPLGEVLGVAEFIGAQHRGNELDAATDFGPWAFGPWCWQIGRVWYLREPVPAKGHQGFWYLPDNVWRRVRDGLEEVPTTLFVDCRDCEGGCAACDRGTLELVRPWLDDRGTDG